MLQVPKEITPEWLQSLVAAVNAVEEKAATVKKAEEYLATLKRELEPVMALQKILATANGGQGITQDWLQQLQQMVDAADEQQERITDLEEKNESLVKQIAGNNTQPVDAVPPSNFEQLMPPLSLAEVTAVGTGGDLGKYGFKEKTFINGVMADKQYGRVVASASSSLAAKEINGRTDLTVGTVLMLFAERDVSQYRYMLGPFFSNDGGGGGLTVSIYKCTEDEYSCGEATPISQSVSAIKFRSACQVGRVRWYDYLGDGAATDIAGGVWTLWTNRNPLDSTEDPPEVTTHIVFEDDETTGDNDSIIFETDYTDDTNHNPSDPVAASGGENCGGKKLTLKAKVRNMPPFYTGTEWIAVSTSVISHTVQIDPGVGIATRSAVDDVGTITDWIRDAVTPEGLELWVVTDVNWDTSTGVLEQTKIKLTFDKRGHLYSATDAATNPIETAQACPE